MTVEFNIRKNPTLHTEVFNKLNTFLVIGAFDGCSHDTFIEDINSKQDNSNTKIIFVEPIQEYFNRLQNNLHMINVPRENIILENCCVSNISENVTMAYFNPELEEKKTWYIEGCASVVENGNILNKHLREDFDSSDLLFTNTTALTVREILNKHNLTSIDYIQIDTEGYDQRIFESINLNELNVKYIKFEEFYCTKEFVEKTIIGAEEMGYYYHRDWDVYLIKEDLIDPTATIIF